MRTARRQNDLSVCDFLKVILRYSFFKGSMYEIKKQIYLDLSKTQKSALCNFLRALVKKSPELSVDNILNKFIEDEKYYLEINNSRFEFLADIIDDDQFLKDTEKYLKECQKYYDYKKSQAPIIQAQKEFEKKKRKFLQEVKMSKTEPTKKQLYYYDRLCKKYNIEKKELTSKLEARDEIDRILRKNSLLDNYDD